MTLQAPKRVPRCALTGVPIAPGDLVYVYGVGMTKRRKPRYLERAEDADVVAAPLTLHRHQQEGAVGLEYSLMMSAYFAAAEDEARREQRAFDRAELEEALKWWTTPYGRNRILRGLERKYDPATARRAYEIALTCHREQAEPSEIAKRFEVQVSRVYKYVDDGMKLAGYHRKDCTCSKCQKWQRDREREMRRARSLG